MTGPVGEIPYCEKCGELMRTLARGRYDCVACETRLRMIEAEAGIVFLRDEWHEASSCPCPACVYADGVFVRECKVHAALTKAEAERDALKKELEKVARSDGAHRTVLAGAVLGIDALRKDLDAAQADVARLRDAINLVLSWRLAADVRAELERAIAAKPEMAAS